MLKELILLDKNGKHIGSFNEFWVKEHFFMGVIPIVGDTMVVWNLDHHSEAVVIKRLFDGNDQTITLTLDF